MATSALPVNTGVATLTPSVADAGAAPPEEVVAGDQGDQGDAGDTGDQGDQGDQGDAGDQGDVGDQGDQQGDAAKDTAKPPKELSIKQVNDKFKELANSEFGKANAEWLKQLRHDYNSLFTLKQIFPTPADAKAAKDLLATFGDNPTEGIANLQKAQVNLDDIDAAIASSDPDFVDALFENHPEGSAGLTKHAFSALFKRNPDAYQKLTAPLIRNAYAHESGPVAYMNSAVAALKGGKPEDVAKAIQILESFGKQIEGLDEFIKASTQDPLKPERDKIANERKELNTQAEKNFDATIDAQIFPIRDGIIAKALEPYIKGKNIDDARLTLIKKNILTELQAFATNDANFNTQYNSYRKAKNLQNIVKFMGSKLEEALPGMVDSVAKHFGLSTNAGRPGLKDRQRTVIKGDAKGTQGGNRGAEGTRENPIRVEPDIRTVDTRRTSTIMRLRQKQAWDKNGKFYDWSGK